MKLLLVSDREESYIWDHFDASRFADVDFIVSCGDLKAEYLSFLVTMINKPLFYVPGNHDRPYLKHPPEGCECIDGKLAEYMGLRMLGLGGSMRYNQNEFQYTEEEMQARVNKLMPRIWLRHGIDILVTHAPAAGVDDGQDLCHTGFKCFTNLIDRYKPAYHLHGHNHLEYGKIARTTKRGETAIVNACGYYLLDVDKEIGVKVASNRKVANNQ
jgi:Icc-related predicted phosphoesterase